MIRLRHLFLALIFAASARADWAQWRGPLGDGTWLDAPKIALESPGLEPVWKAPVKSGYSGVTIADGRVYTMDKEGDGPLVKERILCFSAETGEVLWTREYEAQYGELPYAIGPRASVTIHEGRAYAMGADGDMHCLDAVTGEVLWQKDRMELGSVSRPQWGFAASPAIWKDLVIFHLDAPAEGSFVAMDRVTGEVRWRGSNDPGGYCTPFFTRYKDRDLMVVWTPEHIQGMSPDTGTVYWEVPYKITYGVSIASPVVHNGIVLVCGYWHGSRAIALGDSVEEASQIWAVEKELNGLMSQPLAKDGLVYLLEKDHGLTCFDLKTSRKLWDDGHLLTPAGRNPQATLVRLRDSDDVLVLNELGELIHARLDRDGVTEHWREQVVGKTWAHPAYSGRRIYARDDRGLVCVELPTTE